MNFISVKVVPWVPWGSLILVNPAVHVPTIQTGRIRFMKRIHILGLLSMLNKSFHGQIKVNFTFE